MGRKKLIEFLNEAIELDIAIYLSSLKKKERIKTFLKLKEKKRSDVFSYIEPKYQLEIMSQLDDDTKREIIDFMAFDDLVDFLEYSDISYKKYISKEVIQKVDRVVKYPKDSVASIMTTQYVLLTPKMSVNKALKTIKEKAINSETIYTLYVCENKKLIGIVTAKKLLINEKNIEVRELMKKEFISINVNEDKEEASKLLRKYGLLALPVVDNDGLLIGIVTFDDAMKILKEEATEDMKKMMAISGDDSSYLNTSVFKHALSRITWLLILMVSATITGSIISKYETAINLIPLLVSFIPMLMDTGGNCGSQSSTLIIRGLATDEISYKNIFKVLWIEFRVSILVSFVLSFVNAIRIYIIYKDLKLALVVTVSLIVTIIISKLIGALLPILAKKVKLDPAIMAAPLITTIVDSLSILIYFKFASMVFMI